MRLSFAAGARIAGIGRIRADQPTNSARAPKLGDVGSNRTAAPAAAGTTRSCPAVQGDNLLLADHPCLSVGAGEQPAEARCLPVLNGSREALPPKPQRRGHRIVFILAGFQGVGARWFREIADAERQEVDEAEKRGSGLPAALRIFLASILHVPLYARRVENPTTPPVTLSDMTLRKFLTWIYRGRTRPGEFWPVLMAAREVLHSTAAEVPYEFNGRVWSRPVLRLDWPLTYDRRLLDEVWPVTVHLPPGDGTGPAIAWDRLRYWWTRDAACARALINLAYRWHIEGKRLMPADRRRRDGSRHWLTIRDPKAYDRITDRDRELLCFPPGTAHSRRRQRIADGDAACRSW